MTNPLESFSQVSVGEIYDLSSMELTNCEEAIRAIFEWRLTLVRSACFGLAGVTFSFLVAIFVPLFQHTLKFRGWQTAIVMALFAMIALASIRCLTRCVRLSREYVTALAIYSEVKKT